MDQTMRAMKRGHHKGRVGHEDGHVLMDHHTMWPCGPCPRGPQGWATKRTMRVKDEHSHKDMEDRPNHDDDKNRPECKYKQNILVHEYKGDRGPQR